MLGEELFACGRCTKGIANCCGSSTDRGFAVSGSARRLVLSLLRCREHDSAFGLGQWPGRSWTLARADCPNVWRLLSHISDHALRRSLCLF